MGWEERQKENFALLEANGWEVECESPFEIRTKDGSFASGEAANMVLDGLKYAMNNAFSEQEMHECFNAGVNRGITIAAFITRHDIGEEFPSYNKYMEKFKEEEE